LRNTVDSHGLTHYSMAIVVTSFVVNVFLNYSLIFGHFGLPEIGGVGAGYGIAGACWTNFILFSAMGLFHPKLKGYRIYKDWVGPKWQYVREQLQIGLPIGSSIFFEASIFSIAGLLMVHFGSAVVAAHQSVISFTNVFYCLPLSIAMASTIAVGYEVGAERHKEAIQYSYISRVLAIVIAILICAFTFTHMESISALFTNDEEVYNLIYRFLGYGVFFSAFDAIGTPLQGILRGYKDVKIVLYILAESVAARLRENGFRCRTVEISIRDKELFHFSKQTKLKNASNITGEIAEAAYMLYKKSYSLPANEYELKSFGTEFYQKPLRSIGISGSDLVTDFYWEQMDIFMDPKLREKRMKMDVTVDNIRKRFGFYSIQRGLMYRDSILSACNILKRLNV